MVEIQTIIIDDEKLARSRLKHMLSRYENIKIIGEAGSGEEGAELIHRLQPDVIFLDIKMPSLSGFEMLERLEKSPYVIFTTAYDEYALQAFEENTVDYLMKPISEEKLSRAISKLEKILQRHESVTINLKNLLKIIESKENMIKRFSVKLGDKIFLIPDDDICFFHSEEKYTFLHTAEKEHIVSLTLKELEKRLDPEKFLRVHRAYILNIEYIKSIHQWFGGKLLIKMKNNKEVTVSRTYVNRFKEKVNL